MAMIKYAMPRLLVTNARLATMVGGKYSFVDRGAVLCSAEGRIDQVGEMADVAPRSRGAQVMDAKGGLVTPGFVDCHTHLVYGGNRAREFEMRLQGRSYEEIAREGGGISATVRATRAASGDELRSQACVRLEAMMAEGSTTVEIKSGYGLDTANEVKCLRVARSLASGNRVRVKTTLLGAHTVPPEFKGRADDYVSLVCDEMIPAVVREGLADAVDVFCEGIAFTPAQTRRVFETAHRHGLRVKLHADQLSNSGGAALASEFGALSADHLEHADEAGVAALARAGTVAVLLPGAFYMLRETRLPPLEALRKQGVAMALATDCNPGTSPITSPLAILNMACTLFRFTPEEALAGMTIHGARALALEGDVGTLERGKRADLVVWPVEHPAELVGQIGGVRPVAVVFEGQTRTAP
jgi:imidazolonepropionase